MPTTITVNDKRKTIDVDEDMPLLWVLRDVLHMTGTKFGCGAGLCGACTVQIGGEAQFACQTPISAVGDQKITTIEGVGETPIGRAVQSAWIESDVVQCGYCQPGQIMRACGVLAQTPKPTPEQINEGMATNICRCGCYQRIAAAVAAAAEKLA